MKQDLASVVEFLTHAGVHPWLVEPRHGDAFLSKACRGLQPSTRRQKAARIHGFYEFLELRHAGDIHRLTGAVVASPIDAANRPRHAGDVVYRPPPSMRAMAAFFRSWQDEVPTVRKFTTAARDYTMARVAEAVALRLNELVQLDLSDVLFDHGSMGKLHVRHGKGARRSGPRQRVVPMLGAARPVLGWFVAEVRGGFGDDWERPGAPLFPSERGGDRLGGESFRVSLRQAARHHLPGPVTDLTPHQLRHACASRLYRQGMRLDAVQELLGHGWLSSTLRYVHFAGESLEEEYLRACEQVTVMLGEV